MDRKTTAERLVGAVGDGHMPCGLCGAPIQLQETTVVVEAQASGRTCLEVMLRRSDGRSSPSSATTCVEP